MVELSRVMAAAHMEDMALATAVDMGVTGRRRTVVATVVMVLLLWEVMAARTVDMVLQWEVMVVHMAEAMEARMEAMVLLLWEDMVPMGIVEWVLKVREALWTGQWASSRLSTEGTPSSMALSLTCRCLAVFPSFYT